MIPLVGSTSNLLLFLATTAALASAACALGLVAVRVGSRTSVPFRHGLLLAAVAAAVASPLLVAVAFLLPSPLRGEGLGVRGPGMPCETSNGSFDSARDSEPPHPQPLSPEAGARGVKQPPHPQPLSPERRGEQGGKLIRLSATGLALAWAGGTAFLGLRLLAGLIAVARLRRRLVPTDDPTLREAADAAQAELGVPGPVALCESPLARAPFSLGLGHPAIVLPAGLARRLAPDQLRLVLLHEAAHLRRRDHLAALLQAAAGALFWWNPLLRAVSARLSRFREHLCDDLALGPCGPGRRLAETLLAVAEWGTREEVAVGALGLLDDGPAALEERIQRLLPPVRPVETGLSRSARVGLLGLASAFIASALALAPRPADDGPGSAYGEPPPEVSPSPAIPWRMSLPAGFQHTVTLTPLDEGGTRYRLEPRRLNSSGVYEVQGNRLVIVEPNDPRLHGFEWEILAPGRLRLVNQPPVSKTGSNYLGATLDKL